MLTGITGVNVLVTLLSADQKTEGGIIVPGESKDETRLARGTVKNKGPGFLLPFPKQSDDVTALLENQPSPMYLPLDIEIGDTVYFNKSAAETVMLEGQLFHVVPYPEIKLYTRRQDI
jgi:co-chaperonin GroES (HSP10)